MVIIKLEKNRKRNESGDILIFSFMESKILRCDTCLETFLTFNLKKYQNTIKLSVDMFMA